MHYSKITLLLVMACSSASALAQEHRQHGAHEHGGGQLNVALEKNTLMVDLSLPAMNVVGFEHAAKNQHEKDQLEHAETLLKDGVRLLQPSPAGQCELLSVTIESKLLDHEHDGMESDHAEEHEKDGMEADHADEHEHHADEEHADFDVSYEFDCKQADRLEQLALSLFRQFPGTQHLEAQVITATLQTGTELSADNNILNLK